MEMNTLLIMLQATLARSIVKILFSDNIHPPSVCPLVACKPGWKFSRSQRYVNQSSSEADAYRDR